MKSGGRHLKRAKRFAQENFCLVSFAHYNFLLLHLSALILREKHFSEQRPLL